MKNIKLYEKLKEVKGKKIALIAGSILTGALVVAGCSTQVVVDPDAGSVTVTEQQPTEPEVIETADPVEEVVEEKPVEEVTPEVEEGEVAYTAEDVEKHIEEIAPAFDHLTKDELDALVIAVNLDHISEEELETIMAENNYTVESLNESYINSLKYYNMLYVNTANYVNGTGQYDESLADLYGTIDFSSLNMSEEYAELYDQIEHDYCKFFNAGFEFLSPEKLECVTSEEKTASDIMWIMDTNEIDYDNELNNPYLDLMNVKTK